MKVRRRAWQPIYEGTEALEVLAIVAEIVEAVDNAVDLPSHDWARPLLHSYLSAASGDIDRRLTADRAIDAAVDYLTAERVSPALYGGAAGVGWLCAHVQNLFENVDDDFFADLDTSLPRLQALFHRSFKYDLISGTVGMGVYFLERLPSERGAHELSRVVRALAKHAQPMERGRSWFTPPPALPKNQLKQAPGGYYNLGVAHGVPGIIALLSRIAAEGLLDEEGIELLADATDWVISQRLDDGLFPAWVAPGIDSRKSRVAWCYGELGVSVALLAASQSLADRGVREVAIETAVLSADRYEDAGVLDAGLCHGAAGNGHLFNRLWQVTGIPSFRTAADRWYRTAINMRVSDRGIAGYRAWKPQSGDIFGPPEWQDDATFLTGAAGVALALLAAATAVAPDWDEVLLSKLEATD